MKTVMVIDDSKPIRSQVKDFLVPRGYAVVDAINGEDALKKLETNPEVHLFVVDVNMPIVGGLDFCGRMREIPAYKQVPVIMLTTEVAVDLKERARHLGVKAWILKPFEPEPLEKALSLIGV